VASANGQRESIYGDTAEHANAILKSACEERRSVSQSMLGNANGHHCGPVMLDPNDNNIVYFVVTTGGLAKMELSTFNNYVYSH